jgi:membrane-associated phospholipid phosphatase
LGFFSFWILIAYSRVYLKKHFWIDIYGWVVLAVLVFLLVLITIIWE